MRRNYPDEQIGGTNTGWDDKQGDSKMSKCVCGYQLEPVMFQETEYRPEYDTTYATDRVRRNASHLTCLQCLKKLCRRW